MRNRATTRETVNTTREEARERGATGGKEEGEIGEERDYKGERRRRFVVVALSLSDEDGQTSGQLL